MQLKTIINRIHKLPSFIYGLARLVEAKSGLLLEIVIRPRRGSRPVCSGCGQRRPGYDTLALRRFEFVPLWGIPVFFLYARRRVNCRRCGIVVELLPWAEGKSHLTTTYAWFLARWARRLSWTEVAGTFNTSWDTVFRSVRMAVRWGREHMNLENIQSVGIDEILWQKGLFLTVVYQIDNGCKRLLWLGRDRKAATLRSFFLWLGKERSALLKFICSDLWKPYLGVIARQAGTAAHILDRFHIMSHFNKAIDKVRAQEARELRAKGFTSVLKHSRWCFLKRPKNLTENQEIKLLDLLRCNMRTVRSYLLREIFQRFWTYRSPFWAGRFLDQWCTMTMRSRIEPMKRIARMLRTHRPLLLNWFRARGMISAGAVEGLNNKAKLVIRRAYGYRSFIVIETALFHTLGNLPEPPSTHRFC